MSTVSAQKRRRWLIVVAFVAVLCALPMIIAALPSGSVPVALPTLVARIRASADKPYAGYADATGSAGLPSLPQLATVSSLFNGNTSLRIWYASPQRWRVDTLASAAERDVYQTGNSQTIWDSGQNLLTTIAGTTPVRLPRGPDLAPPDLARRMLAAIVPGTTKVTARPARRIAGRTAAGVRLTPSDPKTTIGYVDIWADPATGLPLEVDVTPIGATKPILKSRMLDVSIGPPAAAATTPPHPRSGTGGHVTTNSELYQTLLGLNLEPLPGSFAGLPRTDHLTPGITGVGSFGTGFQQVLAVSVSGRTGYEVMNAANAVGTRATFPHGASVVVSTPLLNLLVVRVNDRRSCTVVAGFVTPAVLRQGAADLIADEAGPR